MEEGRLPPTRIRKPNVLLDQRFPFINNLEVGNKGSLDMQVLIKGMTLEPDQDGNEFKNANLKILSAVPIGSPRA